MADDEKTAEYWTFPTNPEEFSSDDRISFSKIDQKFIAVQEDGAEYEFDRGLKRWIPTVDEDLINQQQAGYFPGIADDLYDANDDGRATQGKKRKNGEDAQNSGRSKKKKPSQPKKNTAVYVTGLPPDATVEEVADLFSRKCGVIAEEIDSGRPRIKMYTDADGKFKGDALVVFFKPQSVDMAIMLLDDTDFRFTPSGLTTGKMHVQAADSSYKKTKYDTDQAQDANKPESKPGNTSATAGGNGNGSDNKNSTDERSRAQDKAKIIKKTQKLDAKLADWDDDEPSTVGPQLPIKGGKKSRVVILAHMFTMSELEADPAAILEIKEDIRDECSKLGAVTNVVLYDKEEDGIVRVKFKDPDAAEMCVHTMHGRHFDGRIVEAYFATGKEKFEKTKEEGDKDDGEGDSD